MLLILSNTVYLTPVDSGQNLGEAFIAVVAVPEVGLRLYARRLFRAIGSDVWLIFSSLVRFILSLHCNFYSR